MIPDDNLIEAMNLNLHMNQEREMNRTYSVAANVSGVDPTTNKIKAVVDTWTNDNQTYMETGWLQLPTPAAGNQYGIQLLPFGGATPTDPKAANQGNNGNQPAAEQLVLNVLGHKKAFYVGGMQTFNDTNVPPSGYQDKSNVKAQAGEWLFKHASGSYIYMSNPNVMTISSLTNPAPVLQTDQTPQSLEQVLNLTVGAYGKNTNTNDDQVQTATGTVNLISDVNGGQTVNTNLNIGATQSQPDSQSQANEANATINLTSDANTAQQTANSIINLLSTQSTPSEQADNTSNINVTSSVTKGQTGNSTLSLLAHSLGAETDTATFTLEAKGKTKATATGTINIDAADMGTADFNITVKGKTSTLNINVTGETNTYNLNVDNGTVNVTSKTSNIMSEAVNLGTGTMERILTDVAAQVYNSHTHSGVTTGSGHSGTPDQTITSDQEAQNAYAS